jgi:hypothetical protein
MSKSKQTITFGLIKYKLLKLILQEEISREINIMKNYEKAFQKSLIRRSLSRESGPFHHSKKRILKRGIL